MNVYIWTSGELKNDYIGEYIPWTPDASRTLLYLPLENNTNDYSGNSRTCTPTSVTFTTVGWVKSAHVWTTGGIIVTPTNFITTSTKYKTVSVLVYWASSQTSARRNIWEWAIQNAIFIWLCAYENSTKINFFSWNTVWNQPNTYMNDIANKWSLITETVGDGVQKFYINWELKQTNTYSSALPAWWNRTNSYEQSQTIFNARNWVSASEWLNWNAREIIFENVLWSDEDVANYYNRIKAKLWF